jgi:hypothetical protein
MPIVIDNHTCYMAVWITGNSLFRWLRERTVSDVKHRDCRGSGLFARVQVDAMRTKTNHAFAIGGSV